MTKNLYDTLAERWCRNGTIWIYSDPHFNDDEMKNLRKDYIGDDQQVKRINSKVGKNDTIIFLGDIGDLSFIKKIRGYKVLIMGNHEKGASNYKRVERFEKIDVSNYLDGKTPNELCIELSDEGQEQYYEDARKKAEREYKTKPDFIKVSNGINYDFHSPFMSWYAYFDNHLFDEVYEGPLMINDRLILSHEPIEGLPKYMFNIHGHDHSNWYKSDNSLNVCAEHIDYTPVNLSGLLKKGLLKDVLSIHRVTINGANKRKQKRNIKNVEKMLEDLKHE